MSNAPGLSRDVTASLGYLLKHAHRQHDIALTAALEPFGVDPRDLGVLRVLAGREPTSQQEVAQLLEVDRTTMVALLDSLETRGIVSRRPSVGDRRRNVIEITSKGAGIFTRAQAAAEAADAEFVSLLSPAEADHLSAALHRVVVGE